MSRSLLKIHLRKDVSSDLRTSATAVCNYRYVANNHEEIARLVATFVNDPSQATCKNCLRTTVKGSRSKGLKLRQGPDNGRQLQLWEG